MAFKKTLIKAVPTIDKKTKYVLSWEIVTEYETESGDYSNQYTHSVDIDVKKKVTQFTKTDLISLMPRRIDSELFPAHYDAFLNPPKKVEEKVVKFDIDQLND